MGFCRTFEIIQSQKQRRLKELMSYASSLDRDELIRFYVDHTIEISNLKNSLQSIAMQRNVAFKKLGEPEENMIDISSLT